MQVVDGPDVPRRHPVVVEEPTIVGDGLIRVSDETTQLPVLELDDVVPAPGRVPDDARSAERRLKPITASCA